MSQFQKIECRRYFIIHISATLWETLYHSKGILRERDHPRFLYMADKKWFVDHTILHLLQRIGLIMQRDVEKEIHFFPPHEPSMGGEQYNHRAPYPKRENCIQDYQILGETLDNPQNLRPRRAQS